MSTEQFIIINGPSIDLMVESFKYAFTPGCKVSVEFRVQMSNRTLPIPMDITGISYESGTPGHFNFTGNLTGGAMGSMEGYYDASCRRGHMRHT